METLAINEIKVIKEILSRYSEETTRDDYKDRIGDIMRRLDDVMAYSIRYEVTDARQGEVEEICSRCADWVGRYASVTDSSRIFDLEELKKEGLALSQVLGEIKATLEAEATVAEEDLRRIRYRLTVEAREGQEKVSVTEAERKAIADPRYGRALEDFRILLRLSNRVREQSFVMRTASGHIQQSVALGRIGMTQESYTVKEYERPEGHTAIR